MSDNDVAEYIRGSIEKITGSRSDNPRFRARCRECNEELLPMRADVEETGRGRWLHRRKELTKGNYCKLYPYWLHSGSSPRKDDAILEEIKREEK